ncbi:flagellar hook-length control protein FliK [Sphingosinicella microcystinivorans]|uniref:flagellar hook-length control protein FliK n=1 Tax=Sphingosinicella microcystinivorans TaxID=335406 RepID=UPI0022F3CA15|nr:flagellar hook-length control protein FliK [Sphingosinicella microcystinivorans]WBX82388.1 flagellar hook-length control protein FliK [Sphingosinicella microcystinivorans]
MSVNATGLGEMLTMPELSVQAAVRPGIPASVPDFLTIMALKAAPHAKGVAVGLPSAGDGNPTAEGAQPLVVPGADASETAESDVDMAFDLPLPAMPAPQPSASEPKASGARFAAVAARHLAPADTETPVPATIVNGEGDASGDADAETPVSAVADSEENADVIVPALVQTVQLPVPPTAPVTSAEAAAVAPGEPEAAPVAVAGRPRAASGHGTPDPGLADAQGAPAGRAGAPPLPQAVVDAAADTATPPGSTAGVAVAAAPAMQRTVLPTPPAARGDDLRAAVETADEADPALRAFLRDRADPETATIPAPPREAAASQTAQAVLAAIHDAAPAARGPQAAHAAQGQAVETEALLDDLFVGNAVEDEWVDRLAADVETLVSGDRREARLHLKPRELGDLFIRLETNGSQAKVHFTVETAAAQGFIADAAPRLQSMMESRGVRLEEASVDVGGGRQDRGESPRETPFGQPLGARPRSAASQAETVRAIVRQTAIERFA